MAALCEQCGLGARVRSVRVTPVRNPGDVRIVALCARCHQTPARWVRWRPVQPPVPV